MKTAPDSVPGTAPPDPDVPPTPAERLRVLGRGIRAIHTFFLVLGEVVICVCHAVILLVWAKLFRMGQRKKA